VQSQRVPHSRVASAAAQGLSGTREPDPIVMDKAEIDTTALLLELHEAHLKAWNEHDLGALGEIYHCDCLIYNTIAPPQFNGLAEFVDHLLPVLQSYSGFRLRTFDRVARVEEREYTGIGWIASRYELEARRREGVYRRSGRWTEVYEKEGGTWKLVHFHSSDDPEPG
jgi:ketosteroid isomerase-like protein